MLDSAELPSSGPLRHGCPLLLRTTKAPVPSGRAEGHKGSRDPPWASWRPQPRMCYHPQLPLPSHAGERSPASDATSLAEIGRQCYPNPWQGRTKAAALHGLCWSEGRAARTLSTWMPWARMHSWSWSSVMPNSLEVVHTAPALLQPPGYTPNVSAASPIALGASWGFF